MSTRTPTLSWQLPTGFTSVHVDVCGDRACSNVYWSANVSGTSVTVGSTLPSGMVFWRLSTVDGGVQSPLVSATWELATLGTHSAPRMTSWPNFADVDGDGYADLIVELNPSGTIQQLPGSPTGILGTARSQYVQPQSCVPNLLQGGDVDGDGFSDVVYDCGGLEIFVLRGSASGFSGSPTYMTAPPAGATFQPGAETVVGDINGDGYADLAGNCIIAKVPSLCVLFGSPAGFASSQTFPLPTGFTNAGLFTAPGAAGDVNGDGYADVYISDSGFAMTGQAWLYLGGPGGLGATPAYTFVAPPIATRFGANGNSVSGPSLAGTVTADVDGDGWLDLVIQSYGSDAAYVLYIYNGSSSGFPAAPSAAIPLSMTQEFTCGGDINGDGYGDLVVEDEVQIPHSVDYKSYIYVFNGGPSGLASTPSQILDSANIPGNGPLDSVRWIALLGDVNGDGKSDFVVGDYRIGEDGSVMPTVYDGSAAIPQAPAFTYTGQNAFASFW